MKVNIKYDHKKKTKWTYQILLKSKSAIVYVILNFHSKIFSIFVFQTFFLYNERNSKKEFGVHHSSINISKHANNLIKFYKFAILKWIVCKNIENVKLWIC